MQSNSIDSMLLDNATDDIHLSNVTQNETENLFSNYMILPNDTNSNTTRWPGKEQQVTVADAVDAENELGYFSNFTEKISYIANVTTKLFDGVEEGDNGSWSYVIGTLPSIANEVSTIRNANFSAGNITQAINQTIREIPYEFRHPTFGVLFAFLCFFTFASNLLVIVAVIKERYLHSVTNYFIASLALADCWIGAFVMPLGAVDEMLYNRWIFSADTCDLWHSCDVLGTTASILNLCVISLDRYWAITDPMTYPSKMTPKTAGVLIALVWFSALLISFPAIFWWRAVSDTVITDKCLFTEDIGYLAFSSTISFYFPLIIMVFTYYKIYRAANEQTKSLRIGSKQVYAISDTGGNVEVTLRIHRGGGCNSFNRNGLHNNTLSHNSSKIACEDRRGIEHFPSTNSEEEQPLRNRRHLNHKNMSLSQRLARISKEKTAAKTLGIVMGVFILCWLPFFSTNLIRGVCGHECIFGEHIILPLVTWLGWINSCMNPGIYAHRSREFRRAFIRVLCCSRSRRRHYYRQTVRLRMKDKPKRLQTSTSTINCSKL